jgi:cytochrome P450
LQTTGHALAFTYGLLALHPDVQETIYNEIMEIGGSNVRFRTVRQGTMTDNFATSQNYEDHQRFKVTTA